MKARKKWKRVSVELSPQALDMIDRLLATGLYGLSRGEVCQRFVFEKLRAFELEMRKLEVTIDEVEQRRKLNPAEIDRLCAKVEDYRRCDTDDEVHAAFLRLVGR